METKRDRGEANMETGAVMVEGFEVKYLIDMGRGGTKKDLSHCTRRLGDIIKSAKGVCPTGFVITSPNGAAMVRTANQL